jgi:hypothetical protein
VVVDARETEVFKWAARRGICLIFQGFVFDSVAKPSVKWWVVPRPSLPIL